MRSRTSRRLARPRSSSTSQTGTTLFSEHETLSLAPASNEKLALTYAALAGLGAQFRIETDVVGRGEQDGSVWRGSLLLVGQGDPTLSSHGLTLLARQIRSLGIRRVTGGILGDESFFDARRTAPGWKRWFYVNESPPLSALTVDRDRYGGRVSRNPALSAALLFRSALRRAGVYVVGGAGTGIDRGDSLPLASIESPPLATIIRWMDLRKRQLHRRAAAEAARDAAGHARHNGVRRDLRGTGAHHG